MNRVDPIIGLLLMLLRAEIMILKAQNFFHLQTRAVPSLPEQIVDVHQRNQQYPW